MRAADELIARTAWLVTRQGTRGRRVKVVAVLNSRWSVRRVANAVELFYGSQTYSAPEMARFAVRPSANPYRPTIEKFGRMDCGHNPWLYARRVSNLRRVNRQLRWEEPPSVDDLLRRLLPQ
jgi:hypothetical protein